MLAEGLAEVSGSVSRSVSGTAVFSSKSSRLAISGVANIFLMSRLADPRLKKG
jgi:hypothetical protein